MEPGRLSGVRCIERLLALGFRIVQRPSGLTILRGRGHLVAVPDVANLAPDMLRAILRSAGVAAAEFFAGLRAGHDATGAAEEASPPSA